MDILALNCGSSSLKYQLFDWNRKEVIAKGMVERVTIGDSFIVHEVPGRETYREEYECPDHKVAMHLIIKTLTDKVHGVVTNLDRITSYNVCYTKLLRVLAKYSATVGALYHSRQ